MLSGYRRVHKSVLAVYKSIIGGEGHHYGMWLSDQELVVLLDVLAPFVVVSLLGVSLLCRLMCRLPATLLAVLAAASAAKKSWVSAVWSNLQFL